VAREKFRGGLSGFFESGQRAGCSDELAQVKQRTSLCFLHLDKLLGLNLGSAPKRRGEKPRIRNKSLHGEVRRLSVRAVKAAGWAFIGAERRALTEGADGSGQGLARKGWEKWISRSPWQTFQLMRYKMTIRELYAHESVSATSI